MKTPAVTDLVIFHYHFLPGGVSTVVEAAVRALRLYGAGIRRVTLAGGVFPLGGFPGEGSELATSPVPELGYAEDRDAGPAAVAAAGRKLADSLLSRFGCEDAIWWVHNHHLGRNPVFTQALLDVARAGRQRLILQVHDFPECGRYPNLARLQRTLSSPPYPVGPSVRYALINRRDRAVLREAGIPEQHLHLLENPLPPGEGRGGTAPVAEVKQALRLPSGRGARPLLLYPVRCIRRKNVLEAALLCRLGADPADLVVTLPGVSAGERGYSRLVERAFDRGWVPGVFGAGPRLEALGLGLQDLVRAGDLVVSSSVLEGFGYLFLQSLAWGRPLLARDLDVLDGVKDLFAGQPAHFYSRVRAPLGASTRRRLLRAYRAKLGRLARLGVLPVEVTEGLDGQLARLCSEPAVEFSYLPVSVQMDLLYRAGRHARLRAELRELNGEPLQALERLLGEGRAGEARGTPEAPDALEGRLDERFGPRRFAASFDGLCRSFGGGPAAEAGPPAEVIWERVIRRFATVGNVRLLHGS